MAHPTHKQIKAVRKVLYDKKRLAATAEDAQQINLLMNFEGPPLQQGDVRISVGDGPNWVTAATGQIDPSVVEAGGRCNRIAARLQTMRSELSQVDCPHNDKQRLMTALHAQSLVWSMRASLWTDTTAPDDVNAAVAPITAHQQQAFQALNQVQAYLRPVSDFHA